MRSAPIKTINRLRGKPSEVARRRDVLAHKKAQRKEWIQTYTGEEFWPLKPKAEAIRLVDIAHALSLVCRFTGHVRWFYSVAEHSVRVSMLAERYAARAGQTDGEQLTVARWGLMHDASEAYLTDIASPIKTQPTFALYRKAEGRLQALIAKACGLPAGEPPEVKQADKILCATEARVLMSAHPAWAALGEPITAASPDADIAADLGWPSTFAESKFLERYRVLAARAAKDNDR